ncbi:Ger(x)C family spore germination protein [Evansella sp. LMS18]|uniref:Ger(x)C family spore germination protein n=1 Tax=Evansella sp. LMS18 TaxID=2924033 RepID=UPI0020CFF33F|nr:Ger(x)C family spore germination protein [Evansella sp. LMS18]UTR10505.1 Ger(x)C family spore germination protein [Evansella sp. LMS18]
MVTRKKTVFFVLLISLICLTGCNTDSKEIDERTIIVGMGIDKNEEGQFIVSIQVPVIVSGGQQGGEEGLVSEFETLSATHDTVWEAIADLEAQTPTILFFGQLKSIMIGERLAKEGIEQVMDVLDRRAPLSNDVLLLIIRKKVEVREFLKNDTQLVNLPALYIDRFFTAEQKLSRTDDVKLFEYRRDRNMISNAATIPLAYFETNTVIEDMAVFKNGKMEGELTGIEAGISGLLKELKMENINYTVLVEGEGRLLEASIRANMNLSYSFTETNPVKIHLEATGKGELVHLETHRDRASQETIDELHTKLEEKIKTDIEGTINKMKDINVEPWLIGHRIWAKDYAYFETLNWNETGWKDAQIDIKVNVEMEQTGQRILPEKIKLGR